MRSFAIYIGTLAVIAPAMAATPLAGTTWRSEECDLTIALGSDGSAAFTWSMGPLVAQWRTEGEQLIVEAAADLREFRGRIAAPDRLEGVHSWTDVAGMSGERFCILKRR